MNVEMRCQLQSCLRGWGNVPRFLRRKVSTPAWGRLELGLSYVGSMGENIYLFRKCLDEHRNLVENMFDIDGQLEIKTDF